MAVEVLTAIASGSALSFEIVNTGLTGRAAPGDGRRTGRAPCTSRSIRGAWGRTPTSRPGSRRSGRRCWGARPAPEGSPPQVPGWVEAQRAQRAARDGVPVLPGTLAALARAAAELGVELPGEVAG